MEIVPAAAEMVVPALKQTPSTPEVEFPRAINAPPPVKYLVKLEITEFVPLSIPHWVAAF
jgi:hypothetical protein